MQRELRQAIRTAVKSQVMDALTDQHQVDLPQALLDQEIKHLKEQMKQRLMQQFGQKDLKGFPEFPDEHFKDEAERRVKLGLVVSELIKANDIKATDEAVTAYLAEMAEPYEDAEKMIAWYRGDREKMSEINAVVTEQAVVDWVLAQAQVKDTEMPYFEAIEWQPKSDDETNEKEDKA